MRAYYVFFTCLLKLNAVMRSLPILFVLISSLSVGQLDSSVAYINGINFVSTNMLIDEQDVSDVQHSGAQWVSLIPFAFMPSLTGSTLTYDNQWQWTGERSDGIRHAVKLLKESGYHVMIKPQIWVGMGEFTGKINMENEADWLAMEASYRNYLMEFVTIAKELDVEMICIGTELENFVQQRPDYWKELISEIRSQYSGKLTYAENWDSYHLVSFWDKLDYIGLDAYFPLQLKHRISHKKLEKSWVVHTLKMDSVAQANGKRILFTEFGYRSIKNTTVAPWDYSSVAKISEHHQKLALDVLLNQFWCKPNYAGGFLWKWWPDHAVSGGPHDSGFSIQNKAAEALVRSFYLSHTECCELHKRSITPAAP